MRFCILLFLPLAAIGASPEEPYDTVVKHAIDLAGQRQFDTAEGILRQTLDRAKREGQNIWIGPILNDLGTISEERNKYFDAQKYYKESIAAAQQMGAGSRLVEANALDNLGSLYYEAGLYTKAEQALLDSINIMNAGGTTGVKLAEALNNLGVVYLAQHRDASAQSSAEEALKTFIAIGGPDSPGAAYSYSLLGAAYHHAGDVSSAEPALLRAADIWKKVYGPADVRTAKGIANLGAFYMDNSQLDKARLMFDEARPIFEKAGLNDRFAVRFFAMYAQLQKKMGNGKEAKTLRQEKDRLETSSLAHAVASQVIDVSGFMPSGK